MTDTSGRGGGDRERIKTAEDKRLEEVKAAEREKQEEELQKWMAQYNEHLLLTVQAIHLLNQVLNARMP